MLACAFGDVHGSQFLGLLDQGRRELEACDLVMLAGDITDGDDIGTYGQVLGRIREMSDGEMVAVFGNEEYDSSRPEYRSRFRISFLDDEAVDLERDGLKVRIVGSTGPLDRPTWWQRANVPDIWRLYRERVARLSALLERGDADVLVLLTHYSPTYSTLEGERPAAFPEMGSKQLEELVLERRPDLVVHAHAHRGLRRVVLAKRQRSLEDFRAAGTEVTIHNVSLPAAGGPTFFEIGRDESGVHVHERP